jgi:UDP-N-acetyl-alpha-D-quinovosamine dehydrogenase
MTNILVTGANGFIGQALCKKLIAENWQVRGTVRSTSYNPELLRGFDVFRTESVGPNTDWSEALLGADCVVHLSARVHMMAIDTHDPLTKFREINVAGTERLARQSALANVRRFIYMSSVKVNGESTDTGRQKLAQPLGANAQFDQKRNFGKPSFIREVRDQEDKFKGAYFEKDIPEPQDPYGISKWEAEQVLQDIAEATGLEVVVLRPPLVYGPWVKANFLRLLKVVDQGIPLPFASVNNRRSLIYLGNLVDAILACIKSPRASGQTYLVSDGEDVSTPELIRRISSAFGKPARLFPFPPVMLKMAGIITGKSVAMDRLLCSLAVDCSKIRRELDWEPPFTMEQGLRETAVWYNKQRSEARGRCHKT